MSAKTVVFDGYDFAAHDLIVVMVDESPTPKAMQLENRAIEDGQVQVSSRYGAKSIRIDGRFRPRATTEQLEDDIDTLIGALAGDKRTLDMSHGTGGTRRYIASANLAINRGGAGSTSAKFSVEFIVPEGYGSDLTTLELVNQTVTAQSIDIAMTVGGTYKAQPDITITVGAGTGYSPSKSINIFNPATTEGITITRNWTSGDTIFFNARDRQVYLNNSQIYTKGAFPSWQPGSAVLSYFDDFTTRSVNILATYTKRWL